MNNTDINALLLGGDIIDSPSDSNINFIKSNLGDLKKDYLYTFGNHDWTFSWDYQTKETEEKYVPMFQDIMKDTEVSYLEYEDLIILAINNGKCKIDKKNIEKVKQILEKNKPTIVMMHVPLATDHIIEENKKIRDRISAIGDGGIKPTEATQEVFDLILSDKYKVFYILSGHMHFGVEDNVNDKIHEIVSAPAYDGNINILKINQ